MTKKLYKFLNGLKSENGNHKWEKGKWYRVNGKLRMCENGFHASEHIQDALRYVQGDTLAVVEVKGDNVEGEDKQCWERMKIVETYDWSKVESLKVAIYSAKESKKYFDGDEEIIDDCIDAVEQILNEYEEGRGPSDDMIKSAKSAWAAARSVAWSAARSAWAAARSAESAESAARSAARLAESAESAARSAGWAAARSAWAALSAESVKKDIHQYCLKIIREEED